MNRLLWQVNTRQLFLAPSNIMMLLLGLALILGIYYQYCVDFMLLLSQVEQQATKPDFNNAILFPTAQWTTVLIILNTLKVRRQLTHPNGELLFWTQSYVTPKIWLLQIMCSYSVWLFVIIGFFTLLFTPWIPSLSLPWAQILGCSIAMMLTGWICFGISCIGGLLFRHQMISHLLTATLLFIWFGMDSLPIKGFQHFSLLQHTYLIQQGIISYVDMVFFSIIIYLLSAMIIRQFPRACQHIKASP